MFPLTLKQLNRRTRPVKRIHQRPVGRPLPAPPPKPAVWSKVC